MLGLLPGQNHSKIRIKLVKTWIIKRVSKIDGGARSLFFRQRKVKFGKGPKNRFSSTANPLTAPSKHAHIFHT